MTLLIADTFTDSLARLTGDEQKSVKTTAFDLQMSASGAGMSFHKLDKARDKNFWSVRVNADIRVIVHKSADSLLLCYVDHHDKAYAWAERRKLEVHPTTGAAQLVEIRETVREIEVPTYVAPVAPAKAKSAPKVLFAHMCASDFLSYGVPQEWVADAQAATEDSLFTLADHLPREAAEALLELATGGTPARPAVAAPAANPFAHPDAQRRFRVMQNVEELERALDYPWEKWSVFLHPAQQELVERKYSGPARAAGSAGTGKTVVALHRATHLARLHPEAHVLLTTFSVTLARMLRQKLDRLVGIERGLSTASAAPTSLRMTTSEHNASPSLSMTPIVVDFLDDVGIALYERSFGTPQIAKPAMIRSLLTSIARDVPGHSYTERFLEQEWTDVVDAWQLSTWEAYRDVARLGRRTRLGEKQRAILWQIFSEARTRLHDGALFTNARIFGAVTDELAGGAPPPYQFVVVDEAQDINVPQLRFLAALAGNRPDALFFAGDLGQRIFQTPFSWKSLGVDVRGRSTTLRINYRTSHQIRRQADLLLGPELADVDGNTETRAGTVSVFNGVPPTVQLFGTEAEENTAMAVWIKERLTAGMLPHEIGVFVRSPGQVPRARDAIRLAGMEPTMPAPGVDAEVGKIVLMPMHLAKGLEFRAVVVAACDDEVLPLQSRVEEVTDESDLEEVYNTERHLLYVACTRARDALLVTGVAPGSEFLGDLNIKQPGEVRT